MIGLHYCYFFATCIHFVKLGNAFPPSLDKKDILEPAAHPHSGSSDTIVGSENQYLKQPDDPFPIWSQDTVGFSNQIGMPQDSRNTPSDLVQAPESLGLSLNYKNLASNSWPNLAQKFPEAGGKAISIDQINSQTEFGSRQSQNSAFLDGTDVLPKFPSIPLPAIPELIPKNIPEFIDGVRQWLRDPQRPECQYGYNELCCQKGAPNPRTGPPGRDPVELSKRRRKCARWSKSRPECYFPEDVFCCFCMDGYQVAYDCSPYHYLETSGFMEVPSPRLVPKPGGGVNSLPETEIDNDPSEDSDGDSPERQKRDDVRAFNFNKLAGNSGDNNNIGGQTWPNPANGGADLMQYMADRRIYNPGRPKNHETCDEDYLLERQVAPKKKYDRKGGMMNLI